MAKTFMMRSTATPTEAQEADRAWKLASQKGLLKICALYLHFFRYYPTWQKSNPERICSLVTDVRNLQGEDEALTPPEGKGKTAISEMAFKLKQKEYVFKFTQCAVEEGTRGTLVLHHDNQEIFSLEMFKPKYDPSKHHMEPIKANPEFPDLRNMAEDWGLLPRWEITDIGAFIEYPWTDDFKELMMKVWTEEEELRRKYAVLGREAEESVRLEKRDVDVISDLGTRLEALEARFEAIEGTRVKPPVQLLWLVCQWTVMIALCIWLLRLMF